MCRGGRRSGRSRRANRCARSGCSGTGPSRPSSGRGQPGPGCSPSRGSTLPSPTQLQQRATFPLFYPPSRARRVGRSKERAGAGAAISCLAQMLFILFPSWGTARLPRPQRSRRCSRSRVPELQRLGHYHCHWQLARRRRRVATNALSERVSDSAADGVLDQRVAMSGADIGTAFAVTLT